MDPTLAEARSQIDAIDREVLQLLARRAAVTRSLAAWKEAHGIAPRDPAREAAMLAERCRQAEAMGLSPWLAEAVTRAVLATTRGLHDDDRAAFARGP
jgi:chorismate mutase-like protein